MKETIFGLTLLFLVFGFATQGAAQTGKVYEIVVTSVGSGGQFCDCLRFSAESPGCLAIDGIGRRQIYGPTTSGGWQSTGALKASTCGVNPPGIPAKFGISFHGTVVSNMIVGEAINEFGNLFSFSGTENAACSLSTCNVPDSLRRSGNSDQGNTWSGKTD